LSYGAAAVPHYGRDRPAILAPFAGPHAEPSESQTVHEKPIIYNYKQNSALLIACLRSRGSWIRAPPGAPLYRV